MIDALVSGKLMKDPSPLKTSQNGNPYCHLLLSVPVGEEKPAVVSCVAFGAAAERIARLKQGDALSVAGALKPSSWIDGKTGDERHGLNVTVSACLTAYDIQKRRGGTNPKPDNTTPPRGRNEAARQSHQGQPPARDEPPPGYDDELMF